MAEMHGKDGKVLVGASTGVSIVAWGMSNLGPALHDASPLQDTWETLQGGGKRAASGSITCNWDEADANVQNALLADAVAGTTVTLLLYVNATKYFSVPAYITLGADVNARGVVMRTFNFRSTGTVSYN